MTETLLSLGKFQGLRVTSQGPRTKARQILHDVVMTLGSDRSTMAMK